MKVRLQLHVNQIRYLIALAPPPKFKVTTLILLTGAQIVKVFSVSPKATIKYQMGISEKWREEHRGKMMVGGKDLDLIAALLERFRISKHGHSCAARRLRPVCKT